MAKRTPTVGYGFWKTPALTLYAAVFATFVVCTTRGQSTVHRTNYVQRACAATWRHVQGASEHAHARGVGRPTCRRPPLLRGAGNAPPKDIFQPFLRTYHKEPPYQSGHRRTPTSIGWRSLVDAALSCGALAMAMLGVGLWWSRALGAKAGVRRAVYQSCTDSWCAVPVSGKGVDEVAYITAEQRQALVAGTQLFLFDIDGVFWRGDELIDGVWDTLRGLKAMGKAFIFVTNNCTKSRASIANKFRSMGYDEIDVAEIYTSSYAAASYLQSIGFPRHKKAYVIGEVGIGQELRATGINHFGGAEDGDKSIELRPGAMVHHDPDVGAVVVGLDLRINYYKIQYAQLCINQNPGCLFIATNRDATAHITNNQEWAVGGSCVGAVEGCTREPIVVGKPSSFVMEDIAQRFGITRQDVCVVGDRLDSDIAFGRNNGTKTLLVMSGVTDEDMLLHSADLQPDYVAHTLAELLTVQSDVC